MKRSIVEISLMVALLAAIPADSLAQDWPQFRGENRDSKVTGFKAPASWPAELTQVWKVQVGTGDATPVLVGKKIYMNTRQGTDEVILCVDAVTGKELWRNQYPSIALTGPSASHPGPRGTPAVSNGKVVTFGAAGILSCLNAETGKVLWRKENPGNLVPQFFTGMSPLIADNMCIAHLGTKDKGEIVAYDLNSGNEKWKWAGDGPSYASPSVMTTGGKKSFGARSFRWQTCMADCHSCTAKVLQLRQPVYRWKHNLYYRTGFWYEGG
jgi:outer membrane protein assembly factor BamB